MPPYTRRFLRQQLGKTFLRDTITGSNTGSWGATASLTVMDATQVDAFVVGEQLYTRSWIRYFQGPLSPSVYQDARVATFNTLSGAWMCLVTATFASGAASSYEIHSILPPAEKDQVISDVVERLRLKKEITINSANDQKVFSIGPEVLDVLNVYVFDYPPASRNIQNVHKWDQVTTASGQEIRLGSSLTQSQQLAILAVTTMTWTPDAINGTDGDTVTIPDCDWLLSGAAAKSYWMLEARAPAQEVKRFQDRRREVAAQFSRLSARYQPHVEREIGALE